MIWNSLLVIGANISILVQHFSVVHGKGMDLKPIEKMLTCIHVKYVVIYYLKRASWNPFQLIDLVVSLVCFSESGKHIHVQVVLLKRVTKVTT